MQGCPLRCKYCHNRDTWNTKGGKEYTADELIENASKYSSYMKASGGGITVSGGEATLQSEFVAELFKKAKENFVSSYGGGESMLKLCQRIYNLLDDLRERSDTETVLLVAHNGIARAVHSYFYDMTNEEFAAFGMKNCQIRRYDF